MLLPQTKILAGIWGFAGDIDKAKERFGSTQPDRLVASMAQAVEQIDEWNKETLTSASVHRSRVD